jgi:RNA polymerase sigma-70 factor (ECF subfamily)
MPVGRRDRDARRERFEVLYAEHYASIYRYVDRRVAGRGDEVPDVVAEVFTAMWRRLDDVPGNGDARLWLYGMARHTLMNHRRARRRRWRLLSRMTVEATLTTQTQDSVEPGDSWLRDAINRLPDPYREVLTLVAWEGCSHAEAAQVLDCSVNAVALRLHKAKRRLQQDPLVAARLQASQIEHDRALDA